MKQVAKLALCALSGLGLQSAAQAAPATYQFDSWYHLYEVHPVAGSDLGVVVSSPLAIDFSVPLSITFIYDPDVALTPVVPPADSPGITYLEAFSAAGAITQVHGSIGGHAFTSSIANTANYSFIRSDSPPGTHADTRLGMVGATSSAEPFAAVLDGKTYTLSSVTFSFRASDDPAVLYSRLQTGAFDSTAFAQLRLTAADGTSMAANYYAGTLSEVPLPAAFWLFGSGLLAPALMRLRRGRVAGC